MRGNGSIKGDDGSLREEFEDVLTRASCPDGEQIRRNAETLAKELRAERDGRGDEAIMELACV